MRHLTTALAASLVAVVILAACSSDSKDDAASTTTTSSSTTTTSTSTTTTVPATTVAPTSPPTAPPTTPTTAPASSAEQCVQLLFAAWANGNRGSAPACAPSGQVDTLFSQPYEGAYVPQPCQGAAGSTYCEWDGPVRLIIQAQNMQPYTITAVSRQPA